MCPRIRGLGRLQHAALVVVMLVLASSAFAASDAPPRERLLLDFGWKFHLGDEWGLAERLDKAGVSVLVLE